jgi:hypothetical protein
VVHFIHLCVFGEGRLGDEDVLDLVLDAEVQLHSLQKCFTSDASLFPCKLGTILCYCDDLLFVI